MNYLKKKVIDAISANPGIDLAKLFIMFKDDPKCVEILAIVSDIYGEDHNHWANEIKKNTTYAKINELIESYGEDEGLTQLFIPEVILSAIIFQKHNLMEPAKKLIKSLFENDSDYAENIFNNKDYLFDGSISIKISNFSNDVDSYVEWILNRIENVEFESFSGGGSSESNVKNFLFYLLNRFSKIRDSELVDELLQRVVDNVDARIVKSKKIKIHLSGELTKSGVLFTINEKALSHSKDGVEISQVRIKKDIIKILKDTGSDLIKDETKDAIADYLLSYFPGIKEAKMIQKVAFSLASNIFEQTSINYITKYILVHKKKIEEMNISLRDYYINYFLTEEFQKFFQENNIEFIAKDLERVFDRLYLNYIQSIDGLLSPELEEVARKKNNSFDLDTYKFILVCNSLFDPDEPIKTKLARIKN
jgi:hypothetical protein